MPETPSTLRDQQAMLAQHVRDPAMHPPPPGIEGRRLAIYRDLFHNSIASLLAGNFPVIRKLLDDAAWDTLVREFYADHHCRTPLFTEVAREFVDYLQQRAETETQDPPWLAELAHYEWVELALQIAQDPASQPSSDDNPGVNAETLLAGQPMVSSLAWPLAYRWPVHRLAPGQLPDAPPATPTLLLIRRDPAGDVHFSELSALVYRLLELLATPPPRCGREVLLALAGEAGATDTEDFLRDGAQMLQRLHAEGTIAAVLPLAR